MGHPVPHRAYRDTPLTVLPVHTVVTVYRAGRLPTSHWEVAEILGTTTRRSFVRLHDRMVSTTLVGSHSLARGKV